MAKWIQQGEGGDCGKVKSRCSSRGAAAPPLPSTVTGQKQSQIIPFPRETGNLDFRDNFPNF